jgi:hypothetical protein
MNQLSIHDFDTIIFTLFKERHALNNISDVKLIKFFDSLDQVILITAIESKSNLNFDIKDYSYFSSYKTAVALLLRKELIKI